MKLRLTMFALVAALTACSAIAPQSAPLPTVAIGDSQTDQTATAAPQEAPTNAGGITAGGIVVPRDEVQVVAALAESVRSVDVAVGDVVNAGQVLLRLDDTSLQAQAAQARAALAAAQANYDMLAAGPTAEKLREAEASVMSATAAYSRTLSGARPADVAAARAALNAANAAYERVKAGPQPEDVAAAQAALRSAEAAVKQAQTAYDDAFRRDPAGIGASPAALALEQATNAYAAAKAQFDKAAQPPDPAQLSAALGQLESARCSGPHQRSSDGVRRRPIQSAARSGAGSV
jgi:multidrug efflux pump subunit AcrA (membrane-fusion protein)